MAQGSRVLRKLISTERSVSDRVSDFKRGVLLFWEALWGRSSCVVWVIPLAGARGSYCVPIEDPLAGARGSYQYPAAWPSLRDSEAP